MKAVILVGGSGTRLRPLVDFANKPIILHQIEALTAAGVTEVVLAINPQQWKAMVSFMVEFEKKLNIEIGFSLETEPLGTAGHLSLARSKLIDESDKPFFVLNSDVICKYPLREMIEFHKIHGAEASIMVTQVGEPSKYGVVVMEEATGKVQSFVEKPKTFVGNKINAGIYLLNTCVLDRIKLRPTSIEKEIFPKIVSENKLYAMVFPGFWMDVDEQKDYITEKSLYLESLREKASPELRKEDHIPCRMKALILVGGFGTRLRPLTFSIPKPLIDFANKPMILHQIEALKAVGVTEVVLAINHQQPEVMLNFMREFEKKLDIKITFSQETEPLGTAGPLALARDKLIDESGEPFFVLNSDVICEYPLREMIAFHKTHGAEASIMVTEVSEPSKYGVVVMEETTGRVQSFVEKPKTFVDNKINAGIYLLNPSVLDRIELRPTSIEKEIFPQIVSENKLYAMVLPGFWMDIGQPVDYITGQRLYLESLRKKASPELRKGEHIIGNVIVDESAKIGEKCLIGPNVVIGAGCVIEPGVRLSHCTVMCDAHIKKNSYVSRSIVGWQSTVGRWARIDNITILGKDVHVADEVHCNQIVVNPNTEINS